jgi:hypothetical protein
MNRAQRQALSLIALVFAGASSIATSQGAPAALLEEPKDRLSFSLDQRTEVRHVRVVVAAGEGKAQVTADVPIEVGGLDGKRPVTLTIVRDSDGASVNDDIGTGGQAGTIANLAGAFTAIDSCPSGQTCSASFTFTFLRIAEDTRPDLAFDWSVRATAEWPGLPPPTGSSLDVTIGP